jgi:hypothetical protein
MVSRDSFSKALSLFFLFSLCFSQQSLAATPVHSCATIAEKNALDTRVLQTELMVAALSCNEKAQYGEFVKKFQPQLQQQSSALKSYFSRVYKSKGDYQLNRFVTQMANAVAQRHAHTKPSVFCSGAKSLFTETLQQDSDSIVKLTSQERFSLQHGISQCGVEKKQPQLPPLKMVKN